MRKPYIRRSTVEQGYCVFNPSGGYAFFKTWTQAVRFAIHWRTV